MSVTVELSELDADLWDAFRRGDGWVAVSEHRKLMAQNAKLREELADAPKCETCEAMLDCDECLRADVSHKERRRLSAENARLRSEFESVGIASYLYGRSDLKSENDKLRELAVEMYWDLVAEMPESLLIHRKQQLKELGIEVDE